MWNELLVRPSFTHHLLCRPPAPIAPSAGESRNMEKRLTPDSSAHWRVWGNGSTGRGGWHCKFRFYSDHLVLHLYLLPSLSHTQPKRLCRSRKQRNYPVWSISRSGNLACGSGQSPAKRSVGSRSISAWRICEVVFGFTDPQSASPGHAGSWLLSLPSAPFALSSCSKLGYRPNRKERSSTYGHLGRLSTV